MSERMDDFFDSVAYVPGSKLPNWRTPILEEDDEGDDAVAKFNPNHDAIGRFAATAGNEHWMSESGATAGAMANTFKTHPAYVAYLEGIAAAVRSHVRHASIGVQTTAIFSSKLTSTIVAHTPERRIASLAREFSIDGDGGVHVYHSNFTVHKNEQGAGIGASVLAAAIKTYQDNGFKDVSLHANLSVGAYAWARMGFKPDQIEWNGMRVSIMAQAARDRDTATAALERMKLVHPDPAHSENELVQADYKRLSRIVKKAKLTRQFLKTPEAVPSEAIWKLAAMRMGKHNLGKEALLNKSWEGKLDLSDAVAMAQFHSYTTTKIHKFNPNHDAKGRFASAAGFPKGGGFTHENLNTTSEIDKFFGGREALLGYLNHVTGLKPELHWNFGAHTFSRTQVMMELEGDRSTEKLGTGEPDVAAINMGRLFDVGHGGSVTAHHVYFMLDKVEQGGGFGKQTLAASIDLYQKMGVKTVELHANVDVGGYAWARLGFKPTNDDMWYEVGDHIRQNLNHLAVHPLREYRATRATIAAVNKLLDGNKENLSLIADMRQGDINIGKALLLGTSWDGRLNLTHAKSLANFRQRVAKYNPNHKPKGPGGAQG